MLSRRYAKKFQNGAPLMEFTQPRHNSPTNMAFVLQGSHMIIGSTFNTQGEENLEVLKRIKKRTSQVLEVLQNVFCLVK